MNIAHWKKGSDRFEIVVEPTKAIEFARLKKGTVADVLVVPQIYSDAKKGMLASGQRLQALFGTTDPIEVATHILNEGEVHLTAEYKQKLQQQKKSQLVQMIHRQGVDPVTHAPHPITRIEAAFDECKIRIDENKPAEQQVEQIMKELHRVLAIKFEKKQIELTVGSKYAPAALNTVKHMSQLVSNVWNPDGSWSGIVEIPGGLEQELYDKLNSVTHGTLQARVIKTY